MGAWCVGALLWRSVLTSPFTMSYEVTDEDIIQICNNFLLSAPPGEFMEVVADVRALLADDSIINDSAPATFAQWNTDQMLQVTSPNGGHQVLITRFGEVSDSEYLDPRGYCVVQFNHIRQEVTGSRAVAGEIDTSCESLRAQVDDAAQKYCGDHYANGGCTVYGASSGGSTTITICISSSRFNPNNFWNGRWRSVWTCKVSGSNVSLEGNIRVSVHYYEDGNVQLNTDTKKTASCQAGADNIIKAIKRVEMEFQNALDQSYTTMGDTTFKALRRVLPITRQKIDWNKINNMRIGSEAKRR